MIVERRLNLDAISQKGSLLPPELETKPMDKRFEPWEKKLLAEQLYVLRSIYQECRLGTNQPFELQENYSAFIQYADYEFTQLIQETEITRHLEETGSIHICGRAQTSDEILCICNYLHLLESRGRYAPATYVTSYFPLERGDRYQRQKLTSSHKQEVAYDQKEILNNDIEESYIEMVPFIELVSLLENRGVRRIVQIDSHSPAFSYFSLKEGVHAVDLSAIPLMFRKAIEIDLLDKNKEYITVAGDDGAREMSLLGKDLLERNGYKHSFTLQGSKIKTLTSKTIGFDQKLLEQARGKIAIIIEDIISTGGTMLKTYEALMAAGVEKVIILATHPIFTGDALVNLDKPDLQIITTDSRKPLKDISKSGNITQVELLKLLPLITKFDQRDGDYWGLTGTLFLKELGLCLAPWQTYCNQ